MDQLDQFRTMLQEVEAEVDKHGSLTLDEVLAEMDEIIASATVAIETRGD